MESEFKNEAASQQPSHAFDVFLSYSRRDKDFAVRLENALESYRFPRSLKGVKPNLNVFRDESDMQAAEDYHRTIEQHLKGSAKLVVVCSPDARKSKYVEDEIRRFLETHDDRDIIPVLVKGKANNETTDENEMAFPEVMCENRMPLAANFLGWDTYKGKLHKGAFSSSFYSVLAAINGLDRRRLEQIDEKVRARRRALTLSTASAIILILSVALVFAVISQRQAVAATKDAMKSAKAEEKAKNDALAAAEAEKSAKNQAIISARAEKKARDEAVEAKNKAIAAATAEKKAKDEAIAAARAEEKAKNEAIAQKKAVERLLYTSNMNLAPQAYEAGNVVRASELLRSLRPGGSISKGAGQEDLRGFEWFYLSGLYDRKLGVFDTRSEVAVTAISADGKLLAISSPDKVELLDVASQTVVATLDEEAYTLAFSPDGKILATGNIAGRYKLWDTATHAMSGALKDTNFAKADQVSIAFSPSGRMIATSAFDGALGNRSYKLWDAASHELITRFETEGKTPVQTTSTALAWSPDERSIAIYTGTAFEVRDIASQRQLKKFPTEGYQEIQAMAFSPDGQTLMIGANDNVGVLPLRDGQREASFEVPKGLAPYINQSLNAIIAFAPDGRTFATGVKEGVLSGGEVKLWESGSFKLLTTFQGIGSHGEVASLGFSADGRILVVGGLNGVQLNDTTPDRSSSVTHTTVVRSLAFSADSKRFVAVEGAASPKVMAWDTATHQVLPIEPFAMDVKGHIALSPDGKRLAISHPEGAVHLWDISSHQLVATVDMPERDKRDGRSGVLRRERARPDAVAFAPDGRTIAIGLGNSPIQWWDIGQRRFLTELGKSSSADEYVFVGQVGFSSDGKLVGALNAESDGSGIEIWDAVSHTRLVGILYAAQTLPTCLALSSDGKVLAVGMSAGTVELLDLASLVKSAKQLTGERVSPDKRKLRAQELSLLNDEDRKRFVLSTLEGPAKGIYAVAFSSDNKTVATAGEDGMVKLWSRSSFQQLLTLDAKVGQIYSVAFSPDNQTLVAGGERGVAFWSARGNEDGPRPSLKARR